MKLFLLTCILIATIAADECPAKLLKITEKDMKQYFKGYYKKVGDIKLNCKYEHDSNIFNLEHKMKAQATFKKRRLNFELKTHSSVFNLFNFSDFDGQICHSKMGKKNPRQDKELIKTAFLKKFAKDMPENSIKRFERNGLVCFKAKIDKKMRKKMRSLI